MSNISDKKVIDFNDMVIMQRELQDLHKDDWENPCPAAAKHQMLYMVEELGECIAIMKKKGDSMIMENPAVRANLCTEISDVLMYLSNVMLCYDISGEELSRAYLNKHKHNMHRDYRAQNKLLYEDDPNGEKA